MQRVGAVSALVVWVVPPPFLPSLLGRRSGGGAVRLNRVTVAGSVLLAVPLLWVGWICCGPGFLGAVPGLLLVDAGHMGGGPRAVGDSGPSGPMRWDLAHS